MKVHRLFNHNPLRNFTYVLALENAQCFVIDPWDAQEILAYLKAHSLELVAVLNTHEHFDHVAGNLELKESTNCEVWVHERALGSIPGATHSFSDGAERLLDGDTKIIFIDTPGHTFSHMCLKLLEKEELVAVFTGDTLFNAGVGNCHNGGDPSTLYESVDGILAKLPDETLVYPGHDYIENNLRFTLSLTPENAAAIDYLERTQKMAAQGEFMLTTIGQEREFNTFLRLNDASLRQALNLVDSSEREVFIKLRTLRNNW